ncbi:MAG: hypothetical protein MMC23_007945 [Stictis urceolatum]|nr:hypothetical protein [Stictis urceolata]
MVKVRARQGRIKAAIDHRSFKHERPAVVQTSGWYSLPGEVRNIIYDFVTEKVEYEIRWLSRHSHNLTYVKLKPEYCKLSWGKRLAEQDLNKIYTKSNADESILVRRKAFEFERHLNNSPNRPMDWPGQAQWLMTCRQMHHEGGSVFYSKAVFSFRGHQLFKHFIERLTPNLAQFIHKINLSHNIPGEPYYTEHAHLKPRVDASWQRTCRMTTNKLTGLRRLDLRLGLNDRPISLAPCAEWRKALRGFIHVGLTHFDLRLIRNDLNSFNNKYLHEVMEEIRRKALGIKYKEARRTHRNRTYRVRIH